MDMTDMGHKMSEPKVTAESPKQSGVDYPCLNLYDKIPSGLEKKEIGDIIDCHVQLKVRRIEMNNHMESGKPKKSYSMSFDVMKMGVMDNHKEDRLIKKMAGLKHGEEY